MSQKTTISEIAGIKVIKADHTSLEREIAEWRQWWEELCELGQPRFGQMGDRLAEFREHLVSHISREESLLSELGAERVYDLSQLRDEHADLLAELDNLIERLRACDPRIDTWGGARSQFEKFVNRLNTHERAEEALLDQFLSEQAAT